MSIVFWYSYMSTFASHVLSPQLPASHASRNHTQTHPLHSSAITPLHTTPSILFPPNTRMRRPRPTSRPTPPQPPQLPTLGIKQTLDPPQPRHDIPILLLPRLLLLLITIIHFPTLRPQPRSTRSSRPLRRLRQQPLRTSRRRRRRNATLTPPMPLTHFLISPRRLNPLPDKSLIPQPHNQNLPPSQLPLPLAQRPGARVALRRGCLPRTEEAVFPQRVEVVHWRGDEDLGGGGVDLAGFEKPEAEATQAGVAGGGVGDGGVQGGVG